MTVRLAGLNAGLIPAAEYTLQIAGEYGLKPTLTSVHRSMKEQAELRLRYEQCLARGEQIKPSNLNPACRYPANRPGDSGHNWGLAWDSWVPPDQMQLWAAIRRAVGWTVPENDLVHAELPGWRNYVRRSSSVTA
jgi:hypothetical protein